MNDMSYNVKKNYLIIITFSKKKFCIKRPNQMNIAK